MRYPDVGTVTRNGSRLADVVGHDTSDDDAARRAVEAGWGYPGLSVGEAARMFAWKRTQEQRYARALVESSARHGVLAAEDVDAEIERYIRGSQCSYMVGIEGWIEGYDRGPWWFEVTSGAVHVSDPAYDVPEAPVSYRDGRSHAARPDDPTYGIDVAAANGRWEVEVEWCGDDDDISDPGQPNRVIAVHSSVRSLSELTTLGRIDVDSGTVIIADRDLHHAHMAKLDPQTGWHDYLCEPVRNTAGGRASRGVYTELDGSGVTVCCHDGMPTVEVYSLDGVALGVQVRFTRDEDDE